MARLPEQVEPPAAAVSISERGSFFPSDTPQDPHRVRVAILLAFIVVRLEEG
jgi:hypothetical protein